MFRPASKLPVLLAQCISTTGSEEFAVKCFSQEHLNAVNLSFERTTFVTTLQLLKDGADEDLRR